MNPFGDIFHMGGPGELMFGTKINPENVLYEHKTFEFVDRNPNNYGVEGQGRIDQVDAFLLLREQHYYNRYGNSTIPNMNGGCFVSFDDSTLPQESFNSICSGYEQESPRDEQLEEAGYDTSTNSIKDKDNIDKKKTNDRRSKNTKASRHGVLEGSLDLSNKRLEEIPRSVFVHRQPIKDNKIATIPSNFFEDLPHLAWCDLRFNEINALPEFTKRHDTLRVLLLQKNKLRSLPYTLGINCVKLKTLSLGGNPLYDPPKNVVEAGLDAIKLYLVQEFSKSNPTQGQDGIFRAAKDFTSSTNPGSVIRKSRRCKKGGKASKKEKSKEEKLDRDMRHDLDHDDDDDDLLSPRIKDLSHDDGPYFPSALYKSLVKAKANRNRNQSKCRDRGCQNESRPYFSGMNRKDATNLQYTNDVWRDVPFNGINEKEVLHKSMEQMRQHICRKFAIQKEKMIQRIKDQEVLSKWRFETRMLQKADRRPGTCCLVEPPYGISSDEVVNEDAPLLTNFKYLHLSPEDFQKEINDCSSKLQNFLENPVSITDSELALSRIREVEEIQQKLCSLKLSTKFPIPS